MRLRHGLRAEVRPQLLARLRTRLLLSGLLLLDESDEVELGELRLRDEARLLLGSHSELGHFPSWRLEEYFHLELDPVGTSSTFQLSITCL